MPEQVYSVPLSTLADGLNALLQSVLELPASQKFDYLLNDEFITSSLQRFLHRRGISYESVLNIEYTPALQAKESSLLPHDDWVSCVRSPFHGNAEVLVTGAYDHCVRVWDGENCLALGTFHREGVKEVSLHPVKAAPAAGATRSSQKRQREHGAAEDFRLASCSKDGTIAGWRFDSSTSKLELLGSVQAHADGIDSVQVSPKMGRLVATASWDTTVKVFEWDRLADGGDTLPSKKPPVVSFTDHTRPVLSCRFSAAHDEQQLYSAGLDGVLKSLDVAQAQLLAQYPGDHAINKIAVRPSVSSAGADLILTACTDNRARLYDSRQKALVKTFSGHRQWLYSAAWIWDEADEHAESGSGVLFATGSEDGTVRVFDLRSTAGALLTMDALHTDGVLDVTYAGESFIVSCGKDNKTRSFSLSKEA
ncbi:ribosome biogenesis protein YTM1 [Strigomonas culicis]|nr:ribosome biogenesis protein YTM1 [Strigomonas culicis]|eukprot:EPY33194.1 ribosome biogenesis protein YTM1 [Strigomonas culicis]